MHASIYAVVQMDRVRQLCKKYNLSIEILEGEGTIHIGGNPRCNVERFFEDVNSAYWFMLGFDWRGGTK